MMRTFKLSRRKIIETLECYTNKQSGKQGGTWAGYAGVACTEYTDCCTGYVKQDILKQIMLRYLSIHNLEPFICNFNFFPLTQTPLIFLSSAKFINFSILV